MKNKKIIFKKKKKFVIARLSSVRPNRTKHPYKRTVFEMSAHERV